MKKRSTYQKGLETLDSITGIISAQAKKWPGRKDVVVQNLDDLPEELRKSL